MNELLQRKVYEYLDSVQDLESITLKDVIKKLIEKDINISQDYFKNKSNKEQLKETIINYRKNLLKPITFEYDIDGNIIYKQGKFSKQEHDLIVQTVDDYIKEHDINMTELCSHVRDNDKKHREIFKTLRELIPNRDKKSLWHFMSRLTGKSVVAAQNEQQQYRGTFTEEEKIRLNELIRIYGHKFSTIASMMDKLPDDCRQMFIRMKGRMKSGAFTQNEDLNLINAVRKATNSLDHHHISLSQLPVKNLPWTAIAIELKNERLPLDYNRRWSIIMKNSRIKEQLPNLASDNICRSNNISNNHISSNNNNNNSTTIDNYDNIDENNLKHVKNDRITILTKRIKLLETLLENDYTDERDVLWAEMDRNFDGYSRCLNVWKDMQKDIKGSSLIGFENKIEQLLSLYNQQLQQLSEFSLDISYSDNNNNIATLTTTNISSSSSSRTNNNNNICYNNTTSNNNSYNNNIATLTTTTSNSSRTNNSSNNNTLFRTKDINNNHHSNHIINTNDINTPLSNIDASNKHRKHKKHKKKHDNDLNTDSNNNNENSSHNNSNNSSSKVDGLINNNINYNSNKSNNGYNHGNNNSNNIDNSNNQIIENYSNKESILLTKRKYDLFVNNHNHTSTTNNNNYNSYNNSYTTATINNIDSNNSNINSDKLKKKEKHKKHKIHYDIENELNTSNLTNNDNNNYNNNIINNTTNITNINNDDYDMTTNKNLININDMIVHDNIKKEKKKHKKHKIQVHDNEIQRNVNKLTNNNMNSKYQCNHDYDSNITNNNLININDSIIVNNNIDKEVKKKHKKHKIKKEKI